MKKTAHFIILILTAIFLGSIVGNGAENITFLHWLNYGKSISIDNISVDLIIINFSFGCTFSINIAQLILMLGAFFVYTKFSPMFTD